MKSVARKYLESVSKSTREKVREEYSEYLIKLACSVYKVDPKLLTNEQKGNINH